jgi:hypothetical protein
MNSNSIKKMVNSYVSDVIEGYSILVSKKYEEDDAEIIIYALEKFSKKLQNNVNQKELMSRIKELTSKKSCKSDEIINPASGRCVKKNGAVGKKLLSKNKK